MKWLADNIGNIIVIAVLVAIVGLIIWRMVRNKKKGKSTCGCGCGGCAMKDMCHSKEKQ